MEFRRSRDLEERAGGERFRRRGDRASLYSREFHGDAHSGAGPDRQGDEKRTSLSPLCGKFRGFMMPEQVRIEKDAR